MAIALDCPRPGLSDQLVLELLLEVSGVSDARRRSEQLYDNGHRLASLNRKMLLERDIAADVCEKVLQHAQRLLSYTDHNAIKQLLLVRARMHYTIK